MKFLRQAWVRIPRIELWWAIAMIVLPLTAIAQESNFGKLALNPNNPSGVLRGSTGGSASLPAIIRNRDRHNQQCLGFGDPKPDHVLILEKPFATLRLQVQSNTDTTLVVQGPDDMIRCGDDSEANKNASITDTDWVAGTYRIWIGTATPATQRSYILTIQP